MRSLLVALVVLTLAFASTLRAVSPTRTPFVDVDVVAIDNHDRPVGGLQARDFTIKEDGHPVAITSFAEVNATDTGSAEIGRSLVLVLDDTMTRRFTTRIQNIAAQFIGRARPSDAVDVVRRTHPDDDLSGNRSVAVDRIAEFRGGYLLSHFARNVESMLRTVTRLSRSLQSIPRRRTAVVCIGSQVVCDPYLPSPEESLLWDWWRTAISAAAQAHANVYIVDAGGVESGIDLAVGAGLVHATGGMDFVGPTNFDRVADLIWEQTGHYYLLGYTPTAKPRALHRVDVSIARPGVHPLMRSSRGD